MPKNSKIMPRLMHEVQAASNRLLNNSQEAAFQEVCNAAMLNFIAEKKTNTCLGAIMTFKRPKAISLVIDTYSGTISATCRGQSYKSRIFADRAGYQMAASDLFAAAAAVGERA